MLDVLFITVDSLRADRVGYLGYERDTTPTLDRLADVGVVYENATAHGPTTFTSFPSILTGQHAYQNPDYPVLGGTTIADRFSDAGYHTLSVTSNAWTSPTYEYDRGFDSVHNLGLGPRAADSRWDRIRHRIGDALGDGRLFGLIKGAYDRLRAVNSDDRTEEDDLHDIAVNHIDQDSPTFTWVHYMTVHTPYTIDPDRPTPYTETVPTVEKQREIIEQARETPESVPESDRVLLSDLYDASVQHLDRRIGDLIGAVDLNNTVVCITADHGEAFWEHGYFEHPPELHQELLHVPLMIRVPDPLNQRVHTPVGLSAIPETLELLAGTGDADSNALPPWGECSGPVCSAVAHGSRWEPTASSWNSLVVAVRKENWKLLTEHDGDKQLFDLATDPDESINVTEDNPAVADRLMTRAKEFEEDLVFSGSSEVPAKLKDRLSDLGYLQ